MKQRLMLTGAACCLGGVMGAFAFAATAEDRARPELGPFRGSGIQIGGSCGNTWGTLNDITTRYSVYPPNRDSTITAVQIVDGVLVVTMAGKSPENMQRRAGQWQHDRRRRPPQAARHRDGDDQRWRLQSPTHSAPLNVSLRPSYPRSSAAPRPSPRLLLRRLEVTVQRPLHQALPGQKRRRRHRCETTPLRLNHMSAGGPCDGGAPDGALCLTQPAGVAGRSDRARDPLEQALVDVVGVGVDAHHLPGLPRVAEPPLHLGMQVVAGDHGGDERRRGPPGRLPRAAPPRRSDRRRRRRPRARGADAVREVGTRREHEVELPAADVEAARRRHRPPCRGSGRRRSARAARAGAGRAARSRRHPLAGAALDQAVGEAQGERRRSCSSG